MKRYIITGVTGLRNRGVEALVLPIVEGIQRHTPSADIVLVTDSPDYDEMRLGKYGVQCIGAELTSRVSKVRAKVGRFVSKLDAPAYRDAEELLKDAAAVIATGGDVFSSDYGGLKRHLRPLETALEHGVPVVFLGHSLGPFKSQSEIETFNKVAHRAALVSLREQKSYEYTRDVLKVPADRVHQTADVAFLLEPAPEDRVAKMRAYYGLDSDKPTFALGTSCGITKYANNDPHQHADAWADMVRFIQGELGAQVLLVPHVQERWAYNDDRILATNVIERLGYPGGVKVAALDHDARELKGLVASCDMVVSERMHACIAGLSTATPTVAVKYSVKSEGIMTDFYGDRARELSSLIDFDVFLDRDKSREVIADAWSKRAELKAGLEEKLPEYKAMAEKNFELLAGVGSTKAAV